MSTSTSQQSEWLPLRPRASLGAAASISVVAHSNSDYSVHTAGSEYALSAVQNHSFDNYSLYSAQSGSYASRPAINVTAAVEDDPSVSGTLTKRGRGRPRKHIIETTTAAETPKPSKARSKTGCFTCRSRKKKCDEAKPHCLNCQNNNVVCQGYPVPEVWQGGKQKRSDSNVSGTPSAAAHAVTAILPVLGSSMTITTPPSEPYSAVGSNLDRTLLEYFQHRTSRVLILSSDDGRNPFTEIILPMAIGRPGLMHAVLSLAGVHFCSGYPDARVNERQAYHTSRALRDLSTDRQLSRGAVDDGMIAQSLILLLKAIVAGDCEGEYRVHMNVGRHLITSRRHANPVFHKFLVEFFVYHDLIKSLTSVERQPPLLTVEAVGLPPSLRSSVDSAYLGVFDHLFTHYARITILRDQVRRLRQHGSTMPAGLVADAQMMDVGLSCWSPDPGTSGELYQASRLYCQCARIYLRRTMTASLPNQALSQLVDEALVLVSLLAPGSATLAVLAMPLFLLGCAAFEPRQRALVKHGLERVLAYKQWQMVQRVE